jgi:SAM-dependent methyltransferase
MRESELQAMLALDDRHWWYRGRRRVLRAVLAELPLPPDPRLLDAGCGSGATLDLLAELGRVSGVDASERAVDAARGRGHDDVYVASVEELPFPDDAFDLVTCLDVIEHTPDDVRRLRELRRVTKPDGHLVLTVPAYPSLWSAHDVANRHYRRYTRRALRAATSAAGWRTVRETSFNSLLLAPAAAVRLVRRRHLDANGRSETEVMPTALDPVLELPLRAEAAFIARGGRLPVGLSHLAALRPMSEAAGD